MKNNATNPTDTTNATSHTCSSSGNAASADTSTSPQEQQQQVYDWPPLESNPEVLTDYLHQIGLAESFAIGEVYGFDEDLLALVPQPVYAVIVALEKCGSVAESATAADTTITTTTCSQEIVIGDTDTSNKNNDCAIPFYMKQAGTLDNACGIIACLHAIFNQPSSSAVKDDDDAEKEPCGILQRMIVPHSVLAQFQASTACLSPQERCRALEQDEKFRTVHRNFAQQGQSAAILHEQSHLPVQHHYVAFVVHQGRLLELDGTLPDGPRVVESQQQHQAGSDVLRATIAEVQKRLAAGQITEHLSILTLNDAVESDF